MRNILQKYDHRIIRFFLSGVVNSLFSFSIYSFFIFIGLDPSIAVTLSMFIGVFFNYKTIKTFVFSDAQGSRLTPFALCYVIVLGISIVLLKILDFYEMNRYLAGLIVSIPMACLSYILQRKYVFKKGVSH